MYKGPSIYISVYVALFIQNFLENATVEGYFGETQTVFILF